MIESLDPKVGGPPVVCSRLASAQSARGHTVRIVVESKAAILDFANATNSLQVFESGRATLTDWFFRRSVRIRLAERIADADIVHLHGVWDSLLVAAGLECRGLKVPYVLAPHGMLDPWSLSQKRLKKRVGLALGVRRLLNHARFLHMLNRDELALARPLGLRSEGWVLPNGVNLAETGHIPTDEEFRSAFPNLQRRPYILFLSRIHHKKGLDILADAFALLASNHPDLQLVVAGPDAGERGHFEDRIRNHELTNRTHLVGPLYGSVKWSALSGAACFCLPSRQEGFSMAILEAMASRIPIVISESCHFPEVDEAGAGIVTPLKATAVAQAIDQVLNDRTRAESMAAAGRRLVEGRYTWDRVAEDCDRMYAAAIGAGAALCH